MSAPLVLVLVGTDYHPFDRLVSWADAWATAHPDGARVLVQRGTSEAPAVAPSVAYLDHAELQTTMAEAAVIVSHGGPSTIAESRRIGTVPIVVPRDPARGEHVDGHQMRFAARLEQDGLVLRAADADALAGYLDAALADPATVRIDPADDDRIAGTCERFSQAVARLFVNG